MKTKKRLYSQLSALVLILMITSCAGVKPKRFGKKLGSQIEANEVFNQYFMGFKLYDVETQSALYEINSSKYFAPASNTKLFTFYTSLNYLGDSIPAFKYSLREDSLLIWGTGDPSFLHPDLQQNTKIYNFIKNHFGPVILSNQHYYNERFGPGWAWDDYPYYFSVETAAFPIYGNIARFSTDQGSELKVNPKIFIDSCSAYTPFSNIKSSVWRSEFNNRFKFQPNKLPEKPRDIPIHLTDITLKALLQDTLNRRIDIQSIPPDSINNTIYSIPSDSIYQRMLQESDNFLAEQLLLLCAGKMLDSLSTEAIIRYAIEDLLVDLPDVPIWKDGSGLSRYNLFTPRTMVKLLEKIYKIVPEDRLFKLMPAGGVNGTIEKWYSGELPYVFAKTGTFSNNHSLSGYLIANSGKRLIFSFMHNNYPHSSTVVRQAMLPVLEFIRDNY